MTRLLFPSIPWIRYIIHTYYSELEEEADARVSEIKTLREKLSAKESEIASKSVELTDRRKSRRLAGEREKQQEQKIEALTEQLEQVKIQAKEENTPDESFAAEVEELKEKIQRLSKLLVLNFIVFLTYSDYNLNLKILFSWWDRREGQKVRKVHLA